jgi:endonuclease/exonuclease/phosphatase family metal-dependent hydrolase
MPTARSIRIATYNVHKCRGMDRRTKPLRIAEIVSDLDADVVCLQEVMDLQDGDPEHDQARTILRHLQGYEPVFGETRKHLGGPYGNLTLSRFPVRLWRNYDLTWRKRERRGCLRTDLEVGAEALLHVFNVHLGTGFIERRRQGTRMLGSDVLGDEALSGARIVVGDFNEWTRGLASRLMAGEFDSVDMRAYSRYGRTYPGLAPVLHLDHFYYDRQLKLKGFSLCRSRLALLASDHLPLVADFELPAQESWHRKTKGHNGV